MKLIPGAVKGAMAVRGVGVAEVAKVAGCSKSLVWKTIRGVRNSVAVCAALEALLEPDLSELNQRAEANNNKAA